MEKIARKLKLNKCQKSAGNSTIVKNAGNENLVNVKQKCGKWKSHKRKIQKCKKCRNSKNVKKCGKWKSHKCKKVRKIQKCKKCRNSKNVEKCEK